jgi:hypothetical protein
MENTNDNTGTVVDATSSLGVGVDQTSYAGSNSGASFEQGGVTDVVSGDRPSGGYRHDGVDDFTDLGDIPAVKNEPAVSFGGVVGGLEQPELSDEAEMIGNFRSSSFQNSLAITVDPVNDEIEAFTGRSGNRVTAKSSRPTDNEPHHYFATFNSGSLRLFIDGSQVASASNGPSLTPDLPLSLMTRKFQSRFVPGIIDDVRFYNRQLSATEVAEMVKNIDL